MDKAKEFNRDEFMAEASNLFEAAGKAPEKEYTDFMGKTYTECPGTYNDYMVRSMASDMAKAYVSLKDTPFGSKMQSWMPKMTVLNTEVMRMIDDLKGDRPVKGQNLKKWNKLRAEIEDIMCSPEVRDSQLPDLAGKMKAWDERLAYQLAWIYYLRQNYAINYLEPQLGWSEDGADVSPMTGLTPETEGQIKNLIEVRRIMLDTFLKIPVDAPEHIECQTKLEELANAVEAILDKAADECIEAEDSPAADKPQTSETENKELSDVLTAIKTVAGKLASKVSGGQDEASLKDKIITCKVMLSRLEEGLDDEKKTAGLYKGNVEMLRSLADDIELAVLLS